MVITILTEGVPPLRLLDATYMVNGTRIVLMDNLRAGTTERKFSLYAAVVNVITSPVGST